MDEGRAAAVSPARRILRDNGLTLVLVLMFAASLVGHALAGWRVALEEARQHGDAAITLADYVRGPGFLSSVFENWESEFLQMSVYIVLTAMLFQRGSAESRDPDETEPRDDLDRDALAPGAPRMLRAGRAARWLYTHSLGLTLFALFVASFVIHWLQSARVAADEAMRHGNVPPTSLAYLADAQLWFESFQNWQSEFLSTAVLVVLSILLRQQESPESKPLAAPHDQTGD